MNLKLTTRVNGHYKKVYQAFDRELFLALAPRFPKSELLRFDGSHRGDLVEIKLYQPWGATVWQSVITADETNNEHCYFIDEGRQIPFPLRYWKHTHWVIKDGENHSLIVDDIEYSTGSVVLNFLMFPMMFMMFNGRKPVYRKYFESY